MAGTRILGCIAAGGMAVALVGCGGSAAPHPAHSTPAPQRSTAVAGTWAERVRAALSAATSVHMRGTLASHGQAYFVDMSLTKSGALSGKISMGNAGFYLVIVGKKAYFKLTSGFLKHLGIPSVTCAVVCGKYVELPVAGSRSLLGGLNVSALFSAMTGPSGVPAFSQTGTTTVNGQPAVVLHGAGGTADVAATGPAYPLVVILPPSQGSGRIEFTEWNAVPPIAPPPPGDVISLSQLSG